MEEYKRTIGKLSVAQLCQIMGFSSISSQALDTLEEVARLLIEKVAERAKLIAEHSHRTECTFLDILQALEVISCSEDTIKSYISQHNEFSFAREIRFPKPVPRSKEIGLISYNKHNIPSFLPEFPPDHTYMFTPVPITRNMDAATLRAIKIKEKKEIEERLAGINSSSHSIEQAGNPSNTFLNLTSKITTKHLLDD
jgi:histone H3/H4